MKEAIEYFGGDELPASVWYSKYALRDKDDNVIETTPDDMHRRMAREIARIEKKKFKNPYSEDFVYNLFKDFRYIIPQGGPMSAIGSSSYLTSANCFVTSIPDDSYSGICRTDEQLVQICKRRGGVGTDVSKIRPAGALTTNSARSSSGIVPFCERFSNSIREVGQNSRRGALMLTISVHHPQIIDFVTMKLDPTKVTGANVSVRLSDEFLKAVENGRQYELRWPVDSKTPTISKMVDAKEVWNEIIRCAHARAEPGLLFWDSILRESPADCYADIGFATVSSNPCSEIGLEEFGACRLLLLNLFSFVENPFAKKASFDFEKFYEYAQIAQRIMDDIVDIEIECINRIIQKIKKDPEPTNVKSREMELWVAVKAKCELSRRTGTGITALGDAIAAVGLKYGSDKSIEYADEIYKMLKFGCYRSSIDMAKEIGPFQIWNAKKEASCPFFKRFEDERLKLGDRYVLGCALIEDMEKHGRRNIALLTTAPAGSVSIVAGPSPYFGTTSGLEPLFTDEPYTRRKKIVPGMENSRVDFVDELGDKWEHYKVFHAKIKQWMEVTGETDWKKSPYHGCCANDIDWKQRVRLQAAITRHLDHSASSCLAVGENTLWTTEGLLDISEIVSLANQDPLEQEHQFLSKKLFSVNSNNCKAEIVSVYNNGIKDVFRVVLENGSDIVGTPNHKLLVLNNHYQQVWKEIGELQAGDWVVGRKGLNIWNSGSKCLSEMVGKRFEYERKTNSKDIIIPTKMTEELARLLGYLCSGGCVTVNGLSLSQQENNIGPDFISIISRLFNCKTRVLSDNRSPGLKKYDVNSREAAAFFKWLGITDHDNVRVPLAIRKSGKRCVKEFIRGITLDGYVTESGIGVCTSVSKKYLLEIREQLLNYGIESKVRRSAVAGFTLFIADSRDIEKFALEIGFAEKRKNKELFSKYRHPARAKVIGNVPDFGLRLQFRRELLPKIKSNSLYEKFSSVTNTDKQGCVMSRETIQELADMGLQIPELLLDDTYFFCRVTKIVYEGPLQTFDVSVPDGESYIANGVISHNTINLPNDVSVASVAEIYETAWKAGCKGITVYRDGCRDGVLIKENEAKPRIKRVDVPKRPERLHCDIQHMTVRKQPFVVVVGLLDGAPYEVFAFANTKKHIANDKGLLLDKCYATGIIFKSNRGQYELCSADDKAVDLLPDISLSGLLSDTEEALARMVSTALRHGADVNFVVSQLQKARDGDLHSFSKALARALKKYIKDGAAVTGEACQSCGQEALVRQEGCCTCRSCGWSKCG